MKKLLILHLLLFASLPAEAKFNAPYGTEIVGAGSSFATFYMNSLIKKYNKVYPCPQFLYKQTPPELYAGSTHGVNRVLDDTVTFAVSDTVLADTTLENAADCLLQIPFIASTLAIIYNLPDNFGIGRASQPNAAWPGHLNISPEFLCRVYTGNIVWGGGGVGQGLLNQLFNAQTAGGNVPVIAFAPAESSFETELLVKYLQCGTSSITCTFASQPNVVANPSGPFFGTAPGQWGTQVISVSGGSEEIAKKVLATPGSIGYVTADVAYAYGFIPGSPLGIPLGVAGLFIEGRTVFFAPQTQAVQNPLNYTQPTINAVQAAIPDTCTGGIFLCTDYAYPIVVVESFVLYATQPDSLIACNIAQFIQYALTQGQKIGGATPLSTDCIAQSLTHLDKIKSAICDPCITTCNPCLNQTCPLPTCPPCKS